MSADHSKSTQQHDQFQGELRDPMTFKLLSVVLVFLACAGGAVAMFGFPAMITLGLGGTATMFLIILRLTRGDV